LAFTFPAYLKFKTYKKPDLVLVVKIFDPGWVNLILLGSGQVGSAIFGLDLGLKNFPLKFQIFQFFSLRLKKYLGQKRIGCLFFTASQKMLGSSWVAGPISIKTQPKIRPCIWAIFYLHPTMGNLWRFLYFFSPTLID